LLKIFNNISQSIFAFALTGGIINQEEGSILE